MQHVSTRMTNDWMLISPVESVGDDIVMHKLPSSSKLNGDIELKNGKALIKCLRHEVQYKDDFFSESPKGLFQDLCPTSFPSSCQIFKFCGIKIFSCFFKKNTALLSACFMRRSTSSCKNAVTLRSQILKIKQGMVYIYCDGLNKREVIYKVVSELKTTASCS